MFDQKDFGQVHCSRMRTTRSSSCPQGVCLTAWWDPQPPPPRPRCGPGDPSWVWAWAPLGVGLETPMGVGLEPQPQPDPSTSPPPGMWDPNPWRPARHAGIPPALHAGIPPPCEQNDRQVQNITLPQTSFAGLKI